MSTTESDIRDGQAVEEEGTVHYAVHSPVEDDGTNPKARQRASARESTPESAQSQPDSAPSSESTDAPPSVTWSEHLAGARDVLTPPDIWSQERPSLSQVWAHATHGDWTRKTGLPRRAGQIDALFIAVPLVGLAYLLAWIVERPSRRIAAAVLLVLLAQVPPLSWLI